MSLVHRSSDQEEMYLRSYNEGTTPKEPHPRPLDWLRWWDSVLQADVLKGWDFGVFGRGWVCFSMGRIWIKGARRWPVEPASRGSPNDSHSLVLILSCTSLSHGIGLTNQVLKDTEASTLLPDYLLQSSQLPRWQNTRATLWRSRWQGSDGSCR